MKILHIHIPKTAGSFIGQTLAAPFDPADRYVVDLHGTTVDDLAREADAITARYSFVGGHVPFHLVERYAGRFDHVISSTRDPWARAWSSYRYLSLTSDSFRHLAARDPKEAVVQFSRFMEEHYFRNGATRNLQCGYLGSPNTFEGARRAILTHSMHVLGTDTLKADLQALMASIGLTYRDAAGANRSEPAPFALRRGDLPELDRRIAHWFDGDFALCRWLEARRAAALPTV